MPVTLVQQTALAKKVDVSAVADPLSFAAANTAGNTILVAISGWNFAETGTFAASVTDDGGNTYTQVGSATAGSHGRAEVWIAQDANPATTISVTPDTANGSNRFTWAAYEFGGVDAASLGQVATNNGGLSSTGFTATTPVTTTADQAVFSLLSTLWPDAPKTHAVASGYTTLHSHANTGTDPANSMGFLSSWKNVSVTGAQSAAWTYNAQSQGAQGIVVTLKAGTSAGYRVRVEGKDPQAIGATSCIVQIHKAPVDPTSELFGAKIHSEGGYTIEDDGTGKARILLALPGTPDVVVGEQVIVMARGLTGGQSWGSHRWVGTIEEIPV